MPRTLWLMFLLVGCAERPALELPDADTDSDAAVDPDSGAPPDDASRPDAPSEPFNLALAKTYDMRFWVRLEGFEEPGFESQGTLRVDGEGPWEVVAPGRSFTYGFMEDDGVGELEVQGGTLQLARHFRYAHPEPLIWGTAASLRVDTCAFEVEDEDGDGVADKLSCDFTGVALTSISDTFNEYPATGTLTLSSDRTRPQIIPTSSFRFLRPVSLGLDEPIAPGSTFTLEDGNGFVLPLVATFGDDPLLYGASDLVPPLGATLRVVATPQATDLAGNPLADYFMTVDDDPGIFAGFEGDAPRFNARGNLFGEPAARFGTMMGEAGALRGAILAPFYGVTLFHLHADAPVSAVVIRTRPFMKRESWSTDARAFYSMSVSVAGAGRRLVVEEEARRELPWSEIDTSMRLAPSPESVDPMEVAVPTDVWVGEPLEHVVALPESVTGDVVIEIATSEYLWRTMEEPASILVDSIKLR